MCTAFLTIPGNTRNVLCTSVPCCHLKRPGLPCSISVTNKTTKNIPLLLPSQRFQTLEQLYPLSFPIPDKKNSDIGDHMLKKPLQLPYPLPSFSPWTKTLSPSPLQREPLLHPLSVGPIRSPSCLHTAKDARFGGEEEKMMWHCGTHELGRKIGKLLE
jgi:hypothetical protein